MKGKGMSQINDQSHAEPTIGHAHSGQTEDMNGGDEVREVESTMNMSMNPTASPNEPLAQQNNEFLAGSSVTQPNRPIQRAIGSVEGTLENTKGEDGDSAQLTQLQHDEVGNNYIYAVGVLKPEFPNQGLQQAFYNAAQTLGVSEYDYYTVLSYTDDTKHRPYFYIAEQIRWVLTIHDRDTYILQPRAKAELVSFIEALKPPENSLLSVLSTAVGIIAEDQALDHGVNTGLTKVVCNHLFSQTLDSLHQLLKDKTGVATAVIQDVLKGLEYQPNDGRSDFSRAKNFLAYRYPELYITTDFLHKETVSNDTGYFLDEVHTSYTDLASPHVIVDLVFTYKNKRKDTGLKPEVYFHCSVDVTHQFPFVNAPLQEFMPLTLMDS